MHTVIIPIIGFGNSGLCCKETFGQAFITDNAPHRLLSERRICVSEANTRNQK